MPAAGLDTPAVRPIRDDIERRARDLIEELGITEVAGRVAQLRPSTPSPVQPAAPEGLLV